MAGADSDDTSVPPATAAEPGAASTGPSSYPDRGGRLRLRLDIAYDGTAFSGWAVQPDRRTVAGELSGALATLLRAPVPMVVAGRTDAGVHAEAQVAHIDVDPDAMIALAPRHLPTDGLRQQRIVAGLVGLRRRLAGLLPTDVRVRNVTAAPDGFDARFSALRRHYRYRIVTSDWGVPPAWRYQVLHWRRPLDATGMHHAAQPLIGLHDFAAFCTPHPGRTTIRTLQALTVTSRPLPPSSLPPPAPAATVDTGDPAALPDAGPERTELVEIAVTADAFCHSMVRSLVGALLAVGQGRVGPDWPAQLLTARTRTAAITVAPAHGLTLQAVDYPPDAELAARARRTRAMRTSGAGHPL